MARPTTWHRGLSELADSASQSVSHAILMGTFDVGHTITRIRFRYQTVHTDEFPAETSGLGIALGITLLDPEDDPLLVALPYTNANVNDWMWWEASFLLPRTVRDDMGDTFEEDVGPADPGERDVRSQRIIDGPKNLWMTSEVSGLAPTQVEHYLSASYSILTLDPV